MLAKKKLSVLLLSVAFSSAAWAGLGGIAVRSNLGEPLRAEIDLSGEEGELLRVGLATIDTFRDLRVDYSPVLSSLRFTLAQRANGRSYIRVSSLSPISEPYLRFVVEAKMASSRSVREYTVLLDPVDYDVRPNAPVLAPKLPQSAPVQARAGKIDEMAPPRVAAEGKRGMPSSIVVMPGQSLHQLASSLQVGGTSVRQVMAALLEANPSAFPAGNPNMLRAGARLKVPSVSQMKSLGKDRVSAILSANPANTAATEPAAPQAVPPKAPVTAKLPAQKASAAQGEQLVKLEPVDTPASSPVARAPADSEQQLLLQQAQKKIAELEKRLNALQSSAPKPGPLPVAADSEPLLDKIMAYLPLIGGVLATVLLGAASILMLRRRRKGAEASPAAGFAMNAPAAGASAGEPVTAGNTFLSDFTRTGVGGAETGDVDPIAEAEVYLAYGRDQQAEEILKEALQKDPTQHEVRAKLLEIYLARQDRSSFEGQAKSLHDALGGQGTLWDRVAKMGRSLDPANPLYGLDESLGDMAPAAAVVAASPAAMAMDIDLDNELMGDMQPPASASAPASAPAEMVATDVDPLRNALLGEDPFGLDEEPKLLAPELDIESMLQEAEEIVAEDAPAPTPEPEDNKHMLDFDFQLDEPAPSVAVEPASDMVPDGNSVDFDFGLLDAPAEATPAVSTEGLSVSDDPLSTKLDLARVYLDMGDKDGAREVLEELVAEADGSLKQEAASLLAKL